MIVARAMELAQGELANQPPTVLAAMSAHAAGSLRRGGQLDAARKVLDPWVARVDKELPAPIGGLVLYELGYLHHLTDKHDEAIRTFRWSATRSSTVGAMLSQSAGCATKVLRLIDAVSADQTMRRSSEAHELLVELRGLTRAARDLAEQVPEQASRVAKRCVANTLLLEAHLLAVMGAELESAKEHLVTAGKTYQALYDVLYREGHPWYGVVDAAVSIAMRQYGEAIEPLRASQRLAPRESLYECDLALGQALVAMGEESLLDEGRRLICRVASRPFPTSTADGPFVRTAQRCLDLLDDGKPMPALYGGAPIVAVARASAR